MVNLFFNRNLALGALEIMLNISGVLFGCATLQTYIYYRMYPKDPRVLKYFVAVIWLLDLSLHITISHVVYELTVVGWGDAASLRIQPSTTNASFLIGIFIAPLVESFYLFRIYKFSNKLYPTLLGLIIVWLRFAGWVVLVAQEIKLGVISGQFVNDWSWLLITLLSLGAAVNALITATVAYYLYQRRDSGFMRTTKLIDRLIAWTIHTGVTTSILFLVILITFLTIEDEMVWMGVLVCSTKVFSNCLLGSLNGRNSLAMMEQNSLHPAADATQIRDCEMPNIAVNVQTKEFIPNHNTRSYNSNDASSSISSAEMESMTFPLNTR